MPGPAWARERSPESSAHPPAATAGATEFVRGALVAVGAYVMIMALVSIFSASLRSLVHSSHTLTWELMTLGPQLALGICLVLGTAFIRSRGPLKNS
jgi:ABC-type branched-subunit amino acid transport system permease subunit